MSESDIWTPGSTNTIYRGEEAPPARKSTTDRSQALAPGCPGGTRWAGERGLCQDRKNEHARTQRGGPGALRELAIRVVQTRRTVWFKDLCSSPKMEPFVEGGGEPKSYHTCSPLDPK